MSEFTILEAMDIVRKPDAVVEGKVRTIHFMGTGGISGFGNMDRALNVLAAQGWMPKAMSVLNIGMFWHYFAIVEKKE
jgi:hypothetical protein